MIGDACIGDSLARVEGEEGLILNDKEVGPTPRGECSGNILAPCDRCNSGDSIAQNESAGASQASSIRDGTNGGTISQNSIPLPA